MSLLSRLFDQGKPARAARVSEETNALLEKFVAENLEGRKSYHPLVYTGPAGKKLLALPNEERLQLIIHLMSDAPAIQAQINHRADLESSTTMYMYTDLPVRLLRKKTDASVDTLLEMLAIIQAHTRSNLHALPVAGVLRIAERMAEAGPLDPRLTKVFEKLAWSARDWNYSEARKLRDRFRRLAKGDVAPVFDGSLTWVRDVNKMTDVLDKTSAGQWQKILVHASTANAARPSKIWLTKASKLLDDLGQDRYADLAGQCFGLILDVNFRDQPMASDVNSTTVRGLVWMASTFDNEALLTKVHDIGAYSFRKVPGVGAGCSKVGNAAIYTLGAQPGIAAISWLTALKGQVKYRTALALIEKALASAAEQRGITVDTLEELAVPTFGIGESGQLEVSFGEYAAVVSIEGGGKTVISWVRPDGKAQKTVPKAVKDKFADQLKTLRSTARDISRSWIAQRDRIERQFLHPISWTLADWHERYIDQPLMQHIARKLIFEFSSSGEVTLACWFDGALRDVTGKALEFPASTEVTLWHPIGHDADVVLAWRRFLETNEITQAFKQAHREVYVVTDAERETSVYSNRFAGHIIRQHQLAALCRERGWEYSLQGAFDSHNSPTRYFPEADVAVEYFCEAIGDDNPISEMGIYMYVSTDQVRFVGRDHAAIRVAEISPRLFSEIMRDVDLFVGVCSIGNDPNWADGGERGGYGVYWETYAFGELSASAEIRREVLERIVPKLKIADRLSVDGRFLVVRGDIRTYRIHIGSGNIQMEPNNMYLCIVQGNEARKGTQRILLPFEGDGMLSVILSKATLLAADKNIKDPTIVSQIRMG